MKICSKCNLPQPDEEFRTVQKRGKPYTRTFCKQCEYKYKREYYAANPDKAWEYNHTASSQVSRKKYNEENKDYLNAIRRANRAKKKET